ncbi:hypothetical protein Tco_0959878 [Tanacetum coccineum]
MKLILSSPQVAHPDMWNVLKAKFKKTSNSIQDLAENCRLAGMTLSVGSINETVHTLAGKLITDFAHDGCITLSSFVCLYEPLYNDIDTFYNVSLLILHCDLLTHTLFFDDRLECTLKPMKLLAPYVVDIASSTQCFFLDCVIGDFVFSAKFSAFRMSLMLIQNCKRHCDDAE